MTMKTFWILISVGILLSCKPHSPQGSDTASRRGASSNSIGKAYGGLLNFNIPFEDVTPEIANEFWSSWTSQNSFVAKLSDSDLKNISSQNFRALWGALDKYVNKTRDWLKTRCVVINTNEAASTGKLVWDGPTKSYSNSSSVRVNVIEYMKEAPLCQFKDDVKNIEFPFEFFKQMALAALPLQSLPRNDFKVTRVSSGILLVSMPLVVTQKISNQEVTYVSSQNTNTASAASFDPGLYEFFIAGNFIIPRNSNSISPGFAVPVMKFDSEGRNKGIYDFGLLLLQKRPFNPPILAQSTPDKENATAWPTTVPSRGTLSRMSNSSPEIIGRYSPPQDLSPIERSQRLERLPIGSYPFVFNAYPTQPDGKSNFGILFPLKREGNESLAPLLTKLYVDLNQVFFSVGRRHVGEESNLKGQIPSDRYKKLAGLASASLGCQPDKTILDVGWISDGFFASIGMTLAASYQTGRRTLNEFETRQGYNLIATAPPSNFTPIVNGCPQSAPSSNSVQ